MALKVVVWGTGNVGRPAIRAVVAHRERSVDTNADATGFAVTRGRSVLQRVLEQVRQDASERSRIRQRGFSFPRPIHFDHDALALGEKHGYRNAQVSVIAPTGTIGLVMDCDTTGIEPAFALVKFKKLAGGGYFKIINQSVPAALETLGYGSAQIEEIIA